MRTWIVTFVLLAAIGIVAGCKGSSGSSAGPTPIPTSSNRAGMEEIAFGDDFTVGIGTQFCGTSYSGPCSTSPATPGVTQGVNPTGWAQRLAGYFQTFPRYQQFAYAALGVNGALTGDAPINKEGPGGDVLGNSGQFGSLTSIAAIPRSQNVKMLVIVQSGINDVLDAFYSSVCVANGGSPAGGGGATLSSPCSASNTQLAPGGNPRNGTLYAAYNTMLADLNKLAGGPPEATLIVGVPDVGSLPYSVANFSSAQRATLTADSQEANEAMQDAIADATDKAVAYVDWYDYFAANPQYYTTAYYAADVFHLNDQGYAALETLVQQTFASNFPSF